MTNKLFDKIIDIELVERGGTVITILCPREGMKPRITVSGNFYANTIQNGTLKITNFYPERPLNSGNQEGAVYDWLRITAGYADGVNTVMEGQSFLAYTESPGPDGVSCITFFTGPMDVWMTVPMNKNWEAGVSINEVLRDVCDTLMTRTKLIITPKSYIADSVKLEVPGLRASGTFSDLTQKLQSAYGLSMYPEGFNMILCDTYLGKTDTYTLEYVNSIRKTAAGYTIIAPWIPGLRQNDTLIVDSRFYTVENYGAIDVAFDTRFTVVNVAFEFSTTDDVNTMTVLCTGEIKETDGSRKVKRAGGDRIL